MSTDKNIPLSCHKPATPLEITSKYRHTNGAWIKMKKETCTIEICKYANIILYGIDPGDTSIKKRSTYRCTNCNLAL